MIGAHVSVAGGVENAPRNAVRLRCEAIQIFTRSQRQWRAPPLSDQSRLSFRTHLDASGLKGAIAHASYLFNLAGDGLTLSLTRTGLLDEWDRAEALGLEGIVIHPGAHLGIGVEAGLDRVIDSLGRVESRRPAHRSRLLLENTAGQGSCLGHRFEELAVMLRGLRRPERFGVCLDTAHLFAGGYDIRSEAGLRAVLREFQRVVGLEHVRAFHLNDSKTGLGSRVDRHEHIGRGEIGLAPFRALVNDRRFRGLPLILETPGGDAGYRRDLTTLRKLRAEGTASGGRAPQGRP